MNEHRAEWKRRLDDLAERSKQAAQRQQYYGMRARPSYRPNDPGRPTVCLVHGLNSSSGGFVHMFDDLEDAGYGLVVFDYPFNQRLEDSCASSATTGWPSGRRPARRVPGRSWPIRWGRWWRGRTSRREDRADRDVASLIMIAPVNQGAHIARIQPVYQTLSSLFAINSKRTTHALAQLSDGIGQAAEDMLPGSAFLRRINGRPRAADVPYHILAGNSGLISRGDPPAGPEAARRRVPRRRHPRHVHPARRPRGGLAPRRALRRHRATAASRSSGPGWRAWTTTPPSGPTTPS